MCNDKLVHYLERPEGSCYIFGDGVWLVMVVRDVLDVICEDLRVEGEGLWFITLCFYLKGYLLDLHTG